MWSPSAPLLRVGLSAHTVSIARLPRFGLGLGMGLSLGRQQQVEYVPVQADGREPWRAAVDALAQWFAQHKGKRFQVQVLLSGRWVRWQLLPWRADLTGPDERAAYAALCLRETFGPAAQHWQVLPSHLPPGHTAPAAALDAALVEALQAVCADTGNQLHSITPYFSSAFDNWRSKVSAPLAWFGTLEPDTLTLCLFKEGQWAALQTQRLQLPADWRATLHDLQAHMALACDVTADDVPLYLAGDMPEPGQPAAADRRLHWLKPQPLLATAPPGLRLVMGN